MSTNYIVDLGYQTIAITDTLYSQPDPLKRLLDATIAQKQTYQTLQKIRQEAAYEARHQMSSREIAEALGIDRKTIDYMVRCYLKEHPYKKLPPLRRRQKVDSFVDLRES